MTRKVMSQKCATCPFRDGSEYAYLREHLTQSALNEATRFCHSTGNNPVIKRVNDFDEDDEEPDEKPDGVPDDAPEEA